MNEFKIIDKYLKPLSTNYKGSFNLSDDIFYDYKKRIAISVDTYVEGVHFINKKKPEQFLKKILRSSLSDLLCKGIKPKYYLLSCGFNKRVINKNWLKKFSEILSDEQKKFEISLVGGDTTFSSKLIITIVVLGDSKKIPILRSGSRYNDDIFITGDIGDSFIGLGILKKSYNFGKLNSFFIKKYYEPKLQSKFSKYLSKIASSSIDISDGVIQDLDSLCKNSKCGADIDVDLIPLSKQCKSLIIKKKINFKKIFSNGDDYQILFTSNPKNKSKIINLSKQLKTKITKIGRIKKGHQINLFYKSEKFTLEANKRGYIHNL